MHSTPDNSPTPYRESFPPIHFERAVSSGKIEHLESSLAVDHNPGGPTIIYLNLGIRSFPIETFKKEAFLRPVLEADQWPNDSAVKLNEFFGKSARLLVSALNDPEVEVGPSGAELKVFTPWVTRGHNTRLETAWTAAWFQKHASSYLNNELLEGVKLAIHPSQQVIHLKSNKCA